MGTVLGVGVIVPLVLVGDETGTPSVVEGSAATRVCALTRYRQ